MTDAEKIRSEIFMVGPEALAALDALLTRLEKYEAIVGVLGQAAERAIEAYADAAELEAYATELLPPPKWAYRIRQALSTLNAPTQEED